MNTVIIMQARMTSTRLPGKVLAPILGRPMLAFQIERMRRVREADELLIATTTNATDQPIVDFCLQHGVRFLRGSEHDVLARYTDAARDSKAELVVRVTSDCPLLDPQLVDLAIRCFKDGEGCIDYVSNMLQPSWPYGMAVEVFPAQVLFEAQAESTSAMEREHVTPFIYLRPERYRLHALNRTPNLSHLRLTVDTPEDLELVRRILGELYPRRPEFELDDILALLEHHPEWQTINSHIVQKSISFESEQAP